MPDQHTRTKRNTTTRCFPLVAITRHTLLKVVKFFHICNKEWKRDRGMWGGCVRSQKADNRGKERKSWKEKEGKGQTEKKEHCLGK